MQRPELAFLAVACLFAQSPPPAPTPSKPAQADQSQTASKKAKTGNDQQVHEPPPPVIDKEGSATPPRKQQPGHQDSKGPLSNWWLALSAVSTLAIAVLAYRQWRSMQRIRQSNHMHKLMPLRSGRIRYDCSHVWAKDLLSLILFGAVGIAMSSWSPGRSSAGFAASIRTGLLNVFTWPLNCPRSSPRS